MSIIVKHKNLKNEFNRTLLCRKLKMESSDRIIFKRQSLFIFNIMRNLCPTTLAEKLMLRGYINEKIPGVLPFFNLGRYRIGNACPLSSAANFAKRWPQDWFLLTPVKDLKLSFLNCH